MKPTGTKPNQAKRILGDVNFMRSLEEFDKDAIPHTVVKKLKRYIDDPNYTPGGWVPPTVGMEGFVCLLTSQTVRLSSLLSVGRWL
jgi:hypothetical protein